MPSTVHQKIKFPYKGKVVTISAKIEAVVAALKLAPKEIPISLSFEVCMIYEDELDEKLLSMMRRINFMPSMGLGKDQSGPLEFVERKMSILKYGVRYHGLELSLKRMKWELNLRRKLYSKYLPRKALALMNLS